MRVGKHHSLAGRVSLGRVDVLGEQAALCGTRCLPAGSRVRPVADPLRSARPDVTRRARPSARQADSAAACRMVSAALAITAAVSALALVGWML